MRKPTHSQLGDFLRSRRERLSPAVLGYPAVRRRTPGLRREEVAARAGIGVDWYIRLEQGRSTSPSLATLDALATALALDPVERAHLRTLAKAEPPAPFVRETVPPRVRHMVDSLRQPAYVTGRRWDVLAWNRAADELVGFSRLDPDDRNILVWVLTLAPARRLFGAHWEGEAKRIVARFRADYDRWADDPAFVTLLERLRAGCPQLGRWWNAHEVRGSHSGEKLMVHPKKGALRFEHTSFQSNDDPSLRLVVLTPAPVRSA